MTTWVFCYHWCRVRELNPRPSDYKSTGLRPAILWHGSTATNRAGPARPRGKRFPTGSVTIGNPETHAPDQARQAASLLKGQTKTAPHRRTSPRDPEARQSPWADLSAPTRPLRRSPSQAPQATRQRLSHAQACPR